MHADGPEVARRQDAYLQAIADAVNAFADRHGAFVVLYGSEALDRRACEALAPKLRRGAPLMISDDHDHGEMISVLWASDLVLSSRYHAIVCGMAGKGVSAGITMDERIRNLMLDRGTPDLALETEDPDLHDKILPTLERMWADREALREGIDRTCVRNMEVMGRMGGMLVDHVRTIHPDMPFAAHLGEQGDPWNHLPPLASRIEALAERYA